MKYSVATFLDQESWRLHGVSWLRQARSQSLDGYVVGKDLDDDAVCKVVDLGFVHVPLLKTPETPTVIIDEWERHGVKHEAEVKSDKPRRSAIFEPFVKLMEPGQTCLWLNPSMTPTADLSTSADLMCDVGEFDIDFLTSVVFNFYDRAAMAHSLEEKIKAVHGGFLSTKYILGSYDFWIGYLGCQNYLASRDYVVQTWPSEDLVLNFFVAFANSFSVEVRTYPEKRNDNDIAV